jgi:molybdate transport system permease protein
MNRIVGRWGWWVLAGMPLLAFLLLPVGALLYRALSDRAAPTAEFGQAVTLSFQTSLMSIVLILVLGTPLAFAIARFTFPLRKVVNALIDLPVVFPPAAAGIALLLAFGRSGVVPTSFGFTATAVVMAQSFVAAPFYLRAAINAFTKTDIDTESSAALEGAKTWSVFTRIILPQCGAQLTSGAITSWARALGEFGATILFAGNLVGKTQTMPLAIYIGWETDFDQAVSLAAIMLGVAFIAIVAVRLMGDRAKE